MVFPISYLPSSSLFREEIFASADAAYVLAYSIIMLTTDLHSDQVSKVTHTFATRRFRYPLQMAWLADRQVRAMLYATLAVS